MVPYEYHHHDLGEQDHTDTPLCRSCNRRSYDLLATLMVALAAAPLGAQESEGADSEVAAETHERVNLAGFAGRCDRIVKGFGKTHSLGVRKGWLRPVSTS